MSNTDLKPKRRLVTADLGELEAGDVLEGKFKIVDLIGSGATSRVYSAKHLVLDQSVVIKVLSIFGEYEEEAKERFRREGRIVVGLEHKNIVRVTDAGVLSNGYPYIVMPLLEGETLKTWMDNNPVDTRDLFFIERLLIDLCQGLFAAHEKNIVHRDIKPLNIFLHNAKESGRTTVIPKILDFGVARDLSIAKVTRLTLPSQSFGTEGYMSPEQARGLDPDKRSDIFSLGCILYELLTGKRVSPYEPLIAPIKLNRNIPRELNSVCLKALERSPDRRYQSALDFADALCYRQKEPSETALRTDQSNSFKFFVTAGLISVIAAAVFVYFLFKKENISINSEVKTVVDSSLSIPEQRVAVSDNNHLISVKQQQEEPSVNIVPVSEASVSNQVEISKKEILPLKAEVKAQNFDNVINHSATKEKPDKPQELPPLNDSVRIDSLLENAETLLKQKRFFEAEPLLEEVVRHRPKEGRAWWGLGTSAFQREDYSTSINQIEKSLKLEDKPERRILLGHAYLAQGQKERARSEWKKVLSSPSLSPSARTSVEKLLIEMGEDIE